MGPPWLGREARCQRRRRRGPSGAVTGQGGGAGSAERRRGPGSLGCVRTKTTNCLFGGALIFRSKCLILNRTFEIVLG
ncbi:hypothetical protein BRADI_2g25533v3 [Brachypodium distachyon]|uniref:Uncharacterized protein n=1 Tax=Brachypodium distachyon TaxID=15368 RepID=A0A2K2DAG2_BRADI|nr:hypothetical protein BRADI_2g25533v3 [Brachypodium distachyon]